ncbi:MAG: DUF4038 domain-containing protein [Acidobacteria bacterium]|nr:DUF4038 domain-containing protein [Acidobacteriota bacterium]
MRRMTRRSGAALALFAGILVLGSPSPSEAEVEACQGSLPSCHAGSTAQIWECWETQILAGTDYANAYRDLKVTVTFTHVATGTTIQSLASWNGKGTGNKDLFLLRTAFSKTGDWQWSTTCESLTGGIVCNGLNQTSATNIQVEEQPASETNPLYLKGFLTQLVTTDCWPCVTTYKPLAQGTGHVLNYFPFFWLGDAAWAATMKSCPSEWKSYIDRRQQQGFSIVHLAMAPAWLGGCDRDGRAPFTNQPTAPCPPPTQSGMLHCARPESGVSPTAYPDSNSKPNLAYWSRFEGMIQYANNRGLTVLIPGVARPVVENASTNDLRVFARWLGGRLAGSFVILSPGFDDPTTQEEASLFSTIAAELTMAAPRQRKTNHYGTNADVAQAGLHDEPWLGFETIQSGYSCNQLTEITNRAIVIPHTTRGYRYPGYGPPPSTFTNPRKPVINGEGVYDQGGQLTGSPPDHRNRYRARQVGFSSWLTGATGYSLGVGGVWEWGGCGDNPFDREPSEPGIQYPTFCLKTGEGFLPGYRGFSEAMNQPIGVDLSRMKQKLETFAFNYLVVNEQSRIQDNPEAWDERMTVARDASAILVYLPHVPPGEGHAVTVDVSGTLASSCNARFFIPQSGIEELPAGGACSTAGTTITCGHRSPLAALGDGDRMLILRSSGCRSFPGGPSANRLAIWSDTGASGLEPALYAALLDASGQEVVSRSRVSDVQQSLPRNWSIATSSSGNSLVAWEELKSGRERIVYRQLGPKLAPIGGPMSPAILEGSVHLTPSVTWDDVNGGLLSWLEVDQDEGSSRIVAQPVSALGALAGQPEALVEGFVADPRIACATGGDCLLAWKSRAPDGEAVSVWSILLDRSAQPLGTPSVVHGDAESEVWLLAVESTATSGFEILWESFGPETESWGVFRQELDHLGDPVGSEQLFHAPYGEGGQ